MKHYSKEQYLIFIKDWKTSGLSKVTFCRKSKITPSAFSNWLIRFNTGKFNEKTLPTFDLIDVTPTIMQKTASKKQPSIVITTNSGTRLEFYL